PALKKDMVSGYTTVPETGWGVMVPQPIEELEERAGEVKAAALSLIVAGLFIAAILGWFLAGVLIRPVEAVLTAAREIANGRLQARVRRPDRLTPTEFRELATDFNEMATRIESANEKMVAAVERARRADTAKSTFLANMSHEFRTPLNAIIGFADMMRSELLGPIGNRRYRDYAGDIMVSGEHLLDVVNGILDLSKIEAGKMELEDDAVDLPTVLREAQTLVEDDARKAELNLRLEIEAELPAVRGSAVKLKQVALNLLSNATRFTPAGGDVVLSARQEIEGDIVIRCRDTGIGMNEEEIEQSLTPFTQVDGELSRKYEGTGLGLPLARRLVELHDGRLEIESIPHQGTTVTVRLPRKRVGPRAEPQDQAIAAVKGEAAASR
ncbi:MAG: HAMP domain-containing sensor histidine kinase, partial [Alphaproteobacteria bacterium]|nr:HAMP domain-containing sensor histidine kinase [Alphaproteobacteria bacterium]